MKTSMSAVQVAKTLDCHYQTAKNWIDTGEIPHYRTVGGHRRVSLENLAPFMINRGMSIPSALKSVAPAEFSKTQRHYPYEWEILDLFVTSCIVPNPDAQTPADQIFQAFKRWCDLNCYPQQGMIKLALALTKHGYKTLIRKGKTFRTGLQITGNPNNINNQNEEL